MKKPCTYPEMEDDKTCKMKERKNPFGVFHNVHDQSVKAKVERAMAEYHKPIVKNYGFGTGYEPLAISMGIVIMFAVLVVSLYSVLPLM